MCDKIQGNRTQPTIHINNFICKNVEATLSKGILVMTVGLYWDGHNELSIQRFASVSWWQAIGLAMKKETALTKQHWMAKHSINTGVFGVNMKLVLWQD